ncbi:2-amino-4-hydroxy-6-hydroxymethyldihydropteridinepyrophosphokinase [Pseudoprimorskyibacter insulae]|uniref:2-amino-4-hydroxy-6-hydroxymethyldihydropteridine pyrophosphokinase n=2 Tax=Pseudoprimorskyibacter insulae TaxID=1695997 RepID=A0A2R8AUZ6_9RHOB|nr:2-amino-4-hydroxy-6-hydroxymethyldihydropteridinepyrophosphokinase [Pseudoprimorskyibacter insulae]
MHWRALTPERVVESAIKTVADRGVSIRKVSTYYQTPCFPAGAGPDYVNAAFSVSWSGTAQELLSVLHEVEQEHQRMRTVRWGMRTLDLDLIAFGQQVSPSREVFDHWRRLDPAKQQVEAPDQLILPHPRLHERAFVLIPLNDIAPDWTHPVLGRTVRQMLDDLPQKMLDEVVPL